MSTKFTICHNENTHVFGDVFTEDIVGIEVTKPLNLSINSSLEHGSTLTLSLNKDSFAEIARAYICWYDNTCTMK